MATFKRATKEQARLRLGISAPSGGGKSYSALRIATYLAQGGRIAAIDTERGSLSKYSNQFEFDVLELDSYEPATYVQAIHAAEREGYDVIIIDSLSHAWMGKGGALEQVDAAATHNRGENRFTAWREVTPQHNALVEGMLQSKCHLIATMRAKTEYVIEEYTDSRGNKKTKPVKVGLAPVQRDGMEYEFDVMCDMDVDHNLMVSKTRCPELDGKVFNKPGDDFAAILLGWLTDGAPMTERPRDYQRDEVERVREELSRPTNGGYHAPETTAPTFHAKKEFFAEIESLEKRLGYDGNTKKTMKERGYASLAECPTPELNEMRDGLLRELAKLEDAAPEQSEAPFDMDDASQPDPAADISQPEPAAVSNDAAPEW